MNPYLFAIYNKSKMLGAFDVIISHPFCMDLVVVILWQFVEGPKFISLEWQNGIIIQIILLTLAYLDYSYEIRYEDIPLLCKFEQGLHALLHKQ